MSFAISPEHTLTEVKPFLRWAGGKRWLVHTIKERFLKSLEFKSYHETFLGGGALFFAQSGLTKVFLNDLNAELISTYQSVKTNVEDIIEVLLTFKNNEEDYYKIRSTKFRRPIRKAAQFIFLNNYSFNGIYRVNLQGVYNVPYGFRKTEIDYDNLRRAAKQLQNVELIAGDFANTLQNIKKRDLVFLDPPYTVAHNNNGFIKYNQKIFSLEDQHRLAEIIQAIDEIGAYFILTNAAHKTIGEIFKSVGNSTSVSRNSLIGGANAIRGTVNEYIFTNINL